MKKTFYIYLIIVLVGLNACDTGKQLTQTKQTAITSFNNGDYAKALEMYETIISSYKAKGTEKQCDAYTNAGIAASKLGQTEKSIEYLKQATYTEFSNENTYYGLYEVYASKDNLSLELENLEIYFEKYPEGKNIEDVNLRLFEIYTEIENWVKAYEFWDKLTADQQSLPEEIENFLLVNDKLGKDERCLKLSKQLLDLDENNLTALKWISSYYFWRAENRYNKEMKIYEVKKTNKQYAHLLRVIDEVTLEYKEALKYSEKLYKLDPSSKNAKLLGNTYSRLNYKDKADYYQKLGEK